MSAHKGIQLAKKPLLWLGHGIRLSGSVNLIDPLLAHLKIPAVISWAGLDMSSHPMIVGRAGVYGGRAANAIVQHADYILAIGTRLAIPQVGYDFEKFAPHATGIIVDIDPQEAKKHMPRFQPCVMDAGQFMKDMLALPDLSVKIDWWRWCLEQVQKYPVIEPAHAASPGYTSPYLFLQELQEHLKPDAVIVTDSGTALLCAHQVLQLRPPQRLITTTGLGEMGFGLPAAIGASFARDKGEVWCLNTDGGMMFNLQELQTIAHHRLPVKIVVFDNDGYGMIRRTQETLGLARTCVDKASGLSTPDFYELAIAFGLKETHSLKVLAQSKTPCLMAPHISPNQQIIPKVSPRVQPDGSIYSPALDDMSTPA
jgi:acetolactate synthase-1/2/3 large subunit